MSDQIPDDVQKILGPNEQVQLYIKQKIYHPKLNVESVILTTQRIILRHPHDLGLRKDYTDYSYTDIANAVLDKGMLRSTVKCVLRFGGEPLMLNDLPNSEAEKAYGIIRENLVRYQTPSYAGYPSMAQGMGAMMAPAMQQTPQATSLAGGLVCKKCGQRAAQGTRFCGSVGPSSNSLFHGFQPSGSKHYSFSMTCLTSSPTRLNAKFRRRSKDRQPSGITSRETY